MTRVLALTKYGSEAASTRQRLLQYLPALEHSGFEVDVRPLLDDDYVRALATGESYPRMKVLRSYLRRFGDLWDGRQLDLLWIYAELFPKLPSGFERVAARIGTPIIYDFDDAFFHAHERQWLTREKLRPLIAGAVAVQAGNDYLAEFARRWNDNVHVIPTVVDTCKYLPSQNRSIDRPVIGWIGSPSTWEYVRPILPVIADICRQGRARFLAVGAGHSARADAFEGMELREWAKDREIDDVQSMDIGIMPLPDEPWAHGKCGYKLIQYMACGLPVVASSVGVNTAIVSGGEDGLLVDADSDWRPALDFLIGNPEIRARFGVHGRTRILHDYSLQSQIPKVINLFRESTSHASPSPVGRLEVDGPS